jgi:hypothetical protein
MEPVINKFLGVLSISTEARIYTQKLRTLSMETREPAELCKYSGQMSSKKKLRIILSQSFTVCHF